MKKVFALLLVLAMLAAFAACSETPPATQSSEPAPAASSEEPAPVESSEEPAPVESSEEPAPVESSEEPQPVESSEEPAESSEEPVESSDEPVESSDEPAPAEDEVAPFIDTRSAPFVSWSSEAEGHLAKGGLVSTSSVGAKSVKLTGLNKGAEKGLAEVLAFNSDYGKKISSKKGDYSNYAVYVFEYNDDNWHYEKTKSYQPGEAKDDTKIPADGFVLAIHKHFEDYINAVNNASDTDIFYPHGFRGTNDVDAVIKKAKNIVIDGVVDDGEYGDWIWKIEHTNPIVSYEQFPKDDYYATAEVYMAYDADYLYLGVIVSSSSHYCPVTSADASKMWQYECIQVNVCSISPASEYIGAHFDWNAGNDKTASDAGVVRQYGFCVNDAGETISVLWIGGASTAAESSCSRDDANEITYYEAKIPFSECGTGEYIASGTKGNDIGVSVSINSGTAAKNFMNIYLRDGGGIIGINDWTKIPTITLG